MRWLEVAIVAIALIWALCGPPRDRPRYWDLWFAPAMIVFLAMWPMLAKLAGKLFSR